MLTGNQRNVKLDNGRKKHGDLKTLFYLIFLLENELYSVLKSSLLYSKVLNKKQ